MVWLLLLALPSVAFAARPGVSTSRRLLAFALGVVPLAGPVLALLVRHTRGGAVAAPLTAAAPPRRLAAADVARLGDAPPIVDRLLDGDPGERLAALVALSSAGDAAAVTVLRWTVEHGPPDVVLDAALTLEEIDLRSEASLASAQAALTAAPVADAELALAAAHAAESRVLNRLADAALAPVLARTARGFYAQALEWAPARALEILERIARLELAAGQPRAALALLSHLPGLDDAATARLAGLRAAAAFAARVPGAAAARACAPAHPPARRASGELELPPGPAVVRALPEGVPVRELAAAALMG